MYLPIYQSVNLSSYLSIYASIYLSVYLSIYLCIYLSIYLHIYLRYLTTHTYMYAYMLGQGRDKGRRRICFNYAMRAQTHTAVPSTHFRIHDLISSSNSWRRIKCSLHPLGFQTDEVGQLLWILSSVKVHRLANKVLYKCNKATATNCHCATCSNPEIGTYIQDSKIALNNLECTKFAWNIYNIQWI